MEDLIKILDDLVAIFENPDACFNCRLVAKDAIAHILSGGTWDLPSGTIIVLHCHR